MTENFPKRHFALICLVLALGTAALYWPITSHPFILYDDEAYVTDNAHVTTGLSGANFAWAFTSGEAANWHPLTWLSHQADCTLFGLKAGWHHLGNLLFHVVNTLLLFIFLRAATGAVWRSALVAALFAWHPLHVESVAWVSERKDVLSTFFVLAAAGSAVTLLVQSSGGALWHTSLMGRFANAAIAYARYVAKTFWPDDLAIIYAHPEHWPAAMSLGAILVLVAWTVLCVRQWHQKPYLAVGWFWFLGTLVPTIGIIQVGGQYMADRYTYIPSIGLFVVLVWGAADLAMAQPRWKNPILIATGGVLAGC